MRYAEVHVFNWKISLMNGIVGFSWTVTDWKKWRSKIEDLSNLARIFQMKFVLLVFLHET